VVRPVLYILFCNLLGGLTYPWQKLALEGLPPATISAARHLVGLACMAAWLVLRRENPWPWERRDVVRLAFAGIAGIGAPTILGVMGLQSSTATNASILILLEPVSGVVLARLLLGERLTGRRAAGLAIALAGAAAVTVEGGGGAGIFTGEHLVGNLVLCASGLLWGIYTPIAKPLARRAATVPLSFGVLLFAQALLVPASLAEAPRWSAGPHLGQALLLCAAMGVLGSFLGMVLWNAAMRSLPASVVAISVLVQPAAGTLAAWLMLGEDPSPQALVGGAIATAGVLLVLTVPPSPAPKAPAPVAA